MATYPKPDAPYDPSVDEAWLARLPGDLHRRPLDPLQKLYLDRSIAGACPRCGHSINLDIQKDTMVSVGARGEEARPADALQKLPLEFSCNCLATHTKDHSGCGASFSLPWEIAMDLPVHP